MLSFLLYLLALKLCYIFFFFPIPRYGCSYPLGLISYHFHAGSFYFWLIFSADSARSFLGA
jgi:hypothetical protein